MKLLIRELKDDDVDQVMRIEEVSYGSLHWSRDSFFSEIDNPTGNYFVAIDVESGNVIGYCGFWAIVDEAHITTLAVHRDFKRKKVSEALMQHMIKVAYQKEMKWFTLEVRISNLPAISLYKKYGFDSLGVREKYYQDNNEDALIMWTDNIWFDKFKNNLEILKKELEEKVTVAKC